MCRLVVSVGESWSRTDFHLVVNGALTAFVPTTQRRMHVDYVYLPRRFLRDVQDVHIPVTITPNILRLEEPTPANVIVERLLRYERLASKDIGMLPRTTRYERGTSERDLRSGDVNASINAGLEFIEWLAEMVLVDPAWGGCWMWTAFIDVYGYGQTSTRYRDYRGSKKAHRVVFEFFKRRPIKEGYVLDHYECNTRSCVFPDHMREVTIQQNSARRGPKKYPLYVKRPIVRI